MTRQKKSRIASNNGQRHLPATEIRKVRDHKDESKKKGAGLKSGNRNSMQETTKAKTNNAQTTKKDPRLGSKKPIALGKEVIAAEQTTAEVFAHEPKALLKPLKQPTQTPEQELAAIEADAYLQSLLERVENDEVLTGKDAKYFNSKTARLTELLALLGLDNDSNDDSVSTELDPLAQFERTDWRKELLGDED